MQITVDKELLKDLLAYVELQDIYITDDHHVEMREESGEKAERGSAAYSAISKLVE